MDDLLGDVIVARTFQGSRYNCSDYNYKDTSNYIVEYRVNVE
jgi:hypothetical protein